MLYKMPHLDNLRLMVKALMKSDSFFGLFCESDPGVGKSTLLSKVIHDLKVRSKVLSGYASPLALYNALAENANDKNFCLILDDVKGIIESPVGISIIKAALGAVAEESSGSAKGKTQTKKTSGKRVVRWSTNTDLAITKEFSYAGKIIIISNTSTLRTGDGDAMMSRCLSYRMSFDLDQRLEMIRKAAKSRPQKAIYKFFVDEQDTLDPKSIQLRSLQVGVDLYRSDKKSWRRLLLLSLPKKQEDPFELVRTLSATNLPVEQQFLRWNKLTAGSRKTFFNHRKKLGVGKNRKLQEV